MYNELLEYEIIPAIERESLEELSVHEMEEIVEKLDEKVKEYKKLNLNQFLNFWRLICRSLDLP